MKKTQIPKFDRQGWPLPDKYLVELGRIAALWAELEGLLDLAIGKFAGFDDMFDGRAFILVKHSSIPQKLDSLEALCELQPPKFANVVSFHEVIAQLKGAQKLRNRYLHSSMGYDEKKDQVTMAFGSAHGKVKTSVEVISFAELENASVQIHEAMRMLNLLITGKQYPPIWTIRGA